MNSVIRSVALRHAFRASSTVRSVALLGRRSSPHFSVRSNVPSFRTFASPAADELADKLGREYDEELENGNNNMPDDLAEVKTKIEADWKIVDGTVTKLYRQTTDPAFKVQLSFHCQDTVPNENVNHEQDEYKDEDAEEPKEEEEPPEDVQAVRFTVTATKAGKSFVFSCLSENGALRIDGVSVSSADPDDIHAGTVDVDSYQGPEFEELAEDLKDAFMDFAQTDLGVNEDMVTFISMYTDFKEQCDYVQFLQDAKNILSM